MRGKSLFSNEWLKQKRSFIWLVVFIIPLGTTGAMLLDMHLRYKDYLYGVATAKGMTSWQMLLAENHGVLPWGLFLPVFVAVISAIIHYTEWQNQSWKHLLSLPVSRSGVYVSKFVTIVLFSWLMITLNAAGLFLVGKIMGFPEPFSTGLYLKYVLFEFASILGAAALHHWLGSAWNNTILPVVIGFGGMIVSVILMSRPALAVWSPYAYSAYAAGLNGLDPGVALWGGLASGLVFYFAGNITFCRKDII